MKPEQPTSRQSKIHNGSINDVYWLAIGPLLAALLAALIALQPNTARPVSREELLVSFVSAPGVAVDPVVHNIGKYVASSQFLWPELSRPVTSPGSATTNSGPLRRHRPD
jgi:hypothetical protein